MSNIKLIVSDLDGTLVNSDEEDYKISETIIQRVKELRQNDIMFTIATGRPEHSSLWVANRLELQVPYIAYNGGMIIDRHGNILYEKKFPLKNWLEFIEHIDELGNTVLLYFDGKIHYYRYTEAIKVYQKKEKTICYPLDKQKIDTAEVNKILLIGDNCKSILAWEQKLKSNFREKFRYFISESNYVEILEKEISKGEALNILRKQLEVKKDQIVSIGNQMNDKELLEESHIGYAVQNAEQNLKNDADKVTDESYGEGVLEMIDTILEENKSEETLKDIS